MVRSCRALRLVSLSVVLCASDALPQVASEAERAAGAAAAREADQGIVRYKDENGFDVAVHGNTWTIIPPQNVVEAPGPGLKSAEQYRAEGYVYIDRTTGESVRKVADGRYELQLVDNGGTVGAVEIELGSLNDPQVSSSVAVSTDGGLRYEYSVRHRGGQPIMTVTLPVPEKAAVDEVSGASRWVGLVAPSGLKVGWLPLGEAASLKPGDALNSLAVTSKYLPKVTEMRFLGIATRPKAQLPELDDNIRRALSEAHDREGESRRVTIGPGIAPPGKDPDGRARAFRQIIEDVSRAMEAGLITEEGSIELRDILASTEMAGEGPRADSLARVDAVAGMDPLYRQAIRAALTLL